MSIAEMVEYWAAAGMEAWHGTYPCADCGTALDVYAAFPPGVDITADLTGPQVEMMRARLPLCPLCEMEGDAAALRAEMGQGGA